MEEEMTFDINGLLSDEEAERLFEETQDSETQNEKEETDGGGTSEQKNNPAEEMTKSPEKVGEEEEQIEPDAVSQSDGESPDTFYSSIAQALKNDGIFPDFEDEELRGVKSPEDFAELIDKAVSNRFDERQRRIDEALGNGVQPDTIRMYEQTLQYLHSINEEALSSETEEGEALRKQLIYNDLVNRGFSQEKANREVEKSFKSGSDIDDAKDALTALTKFYTTGYAEEQRQAKARVEEAKAARKRDADAFRKMVLEDDLKLGDTKLDKKTCQRVYDAVYKPVYKDPQTGQLLTQVQKYQRENPLEFLKQLGMWYVLTDGGKSIEGFTKQKVQEEKNKNLRELERKINSTSRAGDGSLRFSSGIKESDDPLLSDGWNIG